MIVVSRGIFGWSAASGRVRDLFPSPLHPGADMRLCEETRPKEKVAAASADAGSTPGRPGVPPRCLWSESLARVPTLRVFPLAGRPERGRPLCQPCGASTNASPSMRVTFRVDPPVAGLLTDLIRVIGGQACIGHASRPRLGQQCCQVPCTWVLPAHTCDHARLSLAPPWPYKTKPQVER